MIFERPRHRPERPAQGLVRRRLRSRHRQGGLADDARRVSVVGDAGDRARRRRGRRSSPTPASTFAASMPKTGRELWRLSGRPHAGQGADAGRRRRSGHRHRRLSRRAGGRSTRSGLAARASSTDRALAWQTDRGSPYTGTPLRLRRHPLRLHRQRHPERLRSGDRRAHLPAARQHRGRRDSARRRSPPAAASTWRAKMATSSSSRRAATFELLATNPMGEIADGHAGDLRQHAHRPDADAARGHRG